MNSCHLQDLRVLLWLSSSSRRRRPTEGETRSRRLEERMKTALYFLSLYCSCYMPRAHLRIMKLRFTFCLSIVHVICQEHIWESWNCALLSVSLLFMLYAKNTFENHETALYFLSLYCSCYMPRTHLRIMKLHFTFCLSIVHVICQEHIWESWNCYRIMFKSYICRGIH